MHIEINKKQYYIHILFELLAIAVVVPILLIYLVTKWKNMILFYKVFFILVILLTLLVDGYLLLKWLNHTDYYFIIF